jgi:hypothetical protein
MLFPDSPSFAFLKLDFFSMKVAFYPESGDILECGSPAAAFVVGKT